MSDARKAPAFGNAGNDSMQIYSHQDPERLRDELADFLYEMTEDNFDEERLNTILEALDKAEPVTDLPDSEERLAEFHRKNAHLFEAMEHKTAAKIESSPQKKPTPRRRFKLLPVAAVLLLILLVGSVSAQAFSLQGIFDLFTRWTSEVFLVGGEEASHAAITIHPIEEGEKANYDSLQEALDAFGIKAQLAPTWIPERFTLDKVTANWQPIGINIYAEYTSEDGYLMVYYREITPDTTELEQEGPQVTVFSSGGLRHCLMPNNAQYRAYWQNGELNCYINGTVSKEEMMDMITSIYEGE